jgi:ribosomal-protein-alanine N-acetyltransferase
MSRYDELQTPRLLLRRWREGDRAPFAALNADPVVMEHFPAPMTREQSDALVDRIEEHFDHHGLGFWAVERDGELLGFTGLSWTEGLPFSPALEIGWRLARHAWGHGYATEAATAALTVGLREADSVVSFTAVTNERSWRVMERLGMRREGTFEHPRVPEGSPLRTHYLYRTA